MKKIYEKYRGVIASKKYTKVIYVFGSIVVLLSTFSLGVSVGFHRASFTKAWDEHYMENFGMHGEYPGQNHKHFPNAHGAIGKILKIELPTIIVADKDGTEKVIVLTQNTKIQNGITTIASTDLKINDFIITIGSPNTQGQIEAAFIRILPAPANLNQSNEKPLQ